MQGPRGVWFSSHFCQAESGLYFSVKSIEAIEVVISAIRRCLALHHLGALYRPWWNHSRVLATTGPSIQQRGAILPISGPKLDADPCHRYESCCYNLNKGLHIPKTRIMQVRIKKLAETACCWEEQHRTKFLAYTFSLRFMEWLCKRTRQHKWLNWMWAFPENQHSGDRT